MGEGKEEAPRLSPKALEALMNYHFPGNVRELKNIIESALIKSGRALIQPEHLHFTSVNHSSTVDWTPRKVPQHPTDDATDLKERESLVIQRAQGSVAGSGNTATEGVTDEEKILVYIREHGSINNAMCQTLLDVDSRRATYLLNKMLEYGLLVRSGERRWARYRLP